LEKKDYAEKLLTNYLADYEFLGRIGVGNRFSTFLVPSPGCRQILKATVPVK